MGEEAKLENSDAICRSSRTCDRIESTHLSSTGSSGLPRSACTRRRCSADSWIGVSGFLMSCATCRAISAQASRRCVRSSSPRCRCSSADIALKASTSRRSSSDALVAIRASKSPRAMPAGRARQAVHRIGDALGHRVADRRAQQDEQQRGQHDPPVQLVDLALDLLLAQGERHGEDRVRGRTARTGAAATMKRKSPTCSSVITVGRRSSSDRAVDVGRRARRQQARGEQVALARGQQPRAAEDVDVLPDDAAQRRSSASSLRVLRTSASPRTADSSSIISSRDRRRLLRGRLDVARSWSAMYTRVTRASVTTGMTEAATNARNSLR